MSWADRVTAVADESGGLLSLHVFRQDDMPDLMAHAQAGDPEAFMLSEALPGRPAGHKERTAQNSDDMRVLPAHVSEEPVFDRACAA